MIFAKDELSNSRRILKKGVSTHNLIIACFALSIGLTLVLSGVETWPAFWLLLCGATWNFFCDFKKWTSLIFGFIVGVFYSYYAVVNGLFAHAVLYGLFYIPLQFYVCLTQFNMNDTDIERDKFLNGTQKYYIILISFIVLVFGLVITAGIDNEVFFAMDVISAIMLGISAYLRSFRFHEYFVVRYISLGTAALLWILVMSTFGVAPGTIMMVLLYLMYLISEIVGYTSWKKSYEWVDPVAVTQEEINVEKEKAKKRENKKKKLHEEEIVIVEQKKKRRSEKDPQIYA